MNDYYKKYAKPLGKMDIFELKQNLANWRDSLREELESLIYLRNGLNHDSLNKIEPKVKNKLLDINNKLEAICLKEIECISEFLYDIDKNSVHDVDDKIFTKLEFIRDNYNKILLNIQKMVSSSPILMEMREKYDRNKSSLTDLLRERDSREVREGRGPEKSEKNNKSAMHNEGKEWLDKLNNDLDSIKKDHQKSDRNFDKKHKENSNHNNSLVKKKEYTVDKDLDTIIQNFQKNAEENKYRSSERKKDKEKSYLSNTIHNSAVKSKLNTTNKNSRTRNHTPPEKSHSVSSTVTTQLLSLKNQAPRVTYESIKSLTEEFDHLKKFVKNLKISHEENCIMENEKKDFERIKNDHIKLNADMNILKEDVKEILTNMQQLTKRIGFLEEENKNLRAHNKNLVKFIQGSGTGQGNPSFYMNNTPQYGSNFNFNPGLAVNTNYDEEMNNTKYSHNQNQNQNQFSRANNIMVDNSMPLSELSAFNTVHNHSSVEMNYNVNNNLEKSKKRRFLIPKSEDYQNNY